MKKLILSLGAIGMFTMVQAQHWCGTDEVRRQQIANDPEYLEREAALEADIRRLIEENATLRDDELIITIPVVFHILHLGGVENLTDERIALQMEQLNLDFRKLNPDISQVTPTFQPIAADTRIEFKLATKDPFGNCTNGVNRIQTVQTFIGESTSKMNQWPRDQYLNVWVARQLSRPGLLGYALLPAGAEGPAEIFDGIMILHNTVGVNDPYLGRTLTHEIGHFLNLLHTWGDTNEPGVVCGDDGVEDTPITKGRFECVLGPASADCTEGVEENVQNHMDYSSCPRMYTQGQSDRMRAALNTTTAQRSSLWTEENLIATGVAEGFEAQCAPVADFYAVVGSNLDNPIIPFNNMSCTGTNVRFRDNSGGSPATSWNWTFQDGNPSSSTQRNPTVQFDSPGWKTVTLTASNDQGSSSKTNEYAILISNQSDAWPGGFYASFEDEPSLWPLSEQNFDGNHTFYQRYTGAGAFAGNACARLNSGDRNQLNIINPNNDQDIDDLITPNLDLSSVGGTGSLSFFYSYSTQTTNLANVTEKLEVFSSTDCGRTWQLRTTIQGQALVTGGAEPGPGPWVFRNVSLPGSVMTDNVRFRFRFTSSAFSNDLFIDDINIGAPVGLDEIGAENMLSLFPNPTNDQFLLNVVGMDLHDTEVMIQDLRGAMVYTNVFAPQGGAGIELSARGMGLADGLYVIRVKNELGVSSKKLVVGR